MNTEVSREALSVCEGHGIYAHDAHPRSSGVPAFFCPPTRRFANLGAQEL
jgi:hypothetical protein